MSARPRTRLRSRRPAGTRTTSRTRRDGLRRGRAPHRPIARRTPTTRNDPTPRTVSGTTRPDAEIVTVAASGHVWRPQDFPDHHINYSVVEDELASVIERFRLRSSTFDQFNSSFLIDRLRPRAVQLGLGTLGHAVNTTHNNKWHRYELMKTLANQGLLHAPHHELAIQEARFLTVSGTTIGHPTSEPVTTDDTIDAISHVVTQLAGSPSTVFEQLSNLHMRASPFGPNPLAAHFSAAANYGRTTRLRTQKFIDRARRQRH